MEQSELIKKTLLDTMVYFHNFCEDHQLKYYLVGGTLLGAVRHQGFIPWDDDIDVVMPRRDFLKLLELSSIIKEPYALRDKELDKNYVYAFPKFVSNKLVVREKYYKSFDSGLWIDIFCLGYTFDSVWLQKIHFKLVRMIKVLYILKYGSFKQEHRGKFKLLFLSFFHLIIKFLPRKLFTSFFDFLEFKLAKPFGKKNVANFHGAWGVKEVAPAALFENRTLYQFEEHEFWSVENADYWLRKVYGDYMTPPPPEKRVSPHVGEIIEIN